MPRGKSSDGEDGAKVIALSHDGKPAGDGRPPSQRGRKPSETQAAGLARGRAKMRENQIRSKALREEMRAADERTRWERLSAGELTVRDLDNEELAKMQCRQPDGNFRGRGHNVPAKLARQMKDELLRRGQSEFHKYGAKAIAVVAEIMLSPVEKGADRLRAAAIILERCYGRVPDEVRGTVESAWDDTFDDVTTDYSETG